MTEDRSRPGLEGQGVPSGPHSVVAVMPDVTAARLLMEELEQHGVPPGSIGMEGAVPPEKDEARTAMPEGRAFSDVTRSTVGGAVAGSVVGGILGALLTIPFPDLGLFWAILLGVIFGGGIGLAAGGMAVAKFNSPAWRESYETVDQADRVTVGVHDEDIAVVETAERMMRQSSSLEVRRVDAQH